MYFRHHQRGHTAKTASEIHRNLLQTQLENIGFKFTEYELFYISRNNMCDEICSEIPMSLFQTSQRDSFLNVRQ